MSASSSQARVALIPVGAVVVAIVVMAVAPRDALPTALAVMNETVKVAGFVGLTIAALAFAPGDYLRRGWGLTATCYAMLLLRDAWIHFAPGPETGLEIAGRSLLIVVGNVCVVIGGWTLARAWSVAGLELPVSPAARKVTIGVAIGIAVFLVGPAVVLDAIVTARGEWRHFWYVASDLGDLLALPIVAPVALTALAVSGGSLRWPWLLLATSLMGWIVYDAILTVPAAMRIDDEPFRAPAEVFRVIAGTSALAAGIAQRRAVLDVDLDE